VCQSIQIVGFKGNVCRHTAAATVCAGTFAVFFAAAFFATTVLTASFFVGSLRVVYFAALFAPALFSAQRFLVAAMIAALPAADNLRFALGAAFEVDGSAAFLDAAHLLRWASAILARAAALNLRRFRVGASGVTAGSAGPPSSITRSSAILVSMRAFRDS
jgi:hypothetical protein